MAHISLVTLGVADVDRATEFYAALGWRPSSASVAGTVTFLQGGTVALALFGRQALAQDAGIGVVPPGTPPGLALAMNVGSRDAVDATIATAQRAGGQVTRAAAATDWGGYSGYFVDPDGHLWEVAHNPGFPLDQEGRITLPD